MVDVQIWQEIRKEVKGRAWSGMELRGGDRQGMERIGEDWIGGDGIGRDRTGRESRGKERYYGFTEKSMEKGGEMEQRRNFLYRKK